VAPEPEEMTAVVPGERGGEGGENGDAAAETRKQRRSSGTGPRMSRRMQRMSNEVGGCTSRIQLLCMDSCTSRIQLTHSFGL
jgi:hypothetical protein